MAFSEEKLKSIDDKASPCFRIDRQKFTCSASTVRFDETHLIILNSLTDIPNPIRILYSNPLLPESRDFLRSYK